MEGDRVLRWEARAAKLRPEQPAPWTRMNNGAVEWEGGV